MEQVKENTRALKENGDRYQLSPKESNSQLHISHFVNTCALSLIDVCYSNLLLTQVIETNAQIGFFRMHQNLHYLL